MVVKIKKINALKRLLCNENSDSGMMNTEAKADKNFHHLPNADVTDTGWFRKTGQVDSA